MVERRCAIANRLALHEAEKLLLDRELDLAVERRGRLVEHEDRRILQDHASAIRCRCPPESLTPRSPTCAS